MYKVNYQLLKQLRELEQKNELNKQKNELNK